MPLLLRGDIPLGCVVVRVAGMPLWPGKLEPAGWPLKPELSVLPAPPSVELPVWSIELDPLGWFHELLLPDMPCCDCCEGRVVEPPEIAEPAGCAEVSICPDRTDPDVLSRFKEPD